MKRTIKRLRVEERQMLFEKGHDVTFINVKCNIKTIDIKIIKNVKVRFQEKAVRGRIYFKI